MAQLLFLTVRSSVYPLNEHRRYGDEAFIFGRTDWEYVNNTFVFPVNIGYHFIQTKAGAANGQFSGIGADEADICVKVDAIQPMGLLISNGQFVCMRGEKRTTILVENTCQGSAGGELLLLGAESTMRGVAQQELCVAFGLSPEHHVRPDERGPCL